MKKVIGIMSVGYVLPAIIWNLLMFELKVVPNDVFFKILGNPIQLIYALPVSILLLRYFYKKIKAKDGLDKIAKRYLVSVYLFCLIGPNSGFIGLPITMKQFVLGNVLSLPLIFLFTVPVFLFFIRFLERYLRDDPSVKDVMLVSIPFKLRLSIISTLFGQSVLIFIYSYIIYASPGMFTLKAYLVSTGILAALTISISVINTSIIVSAIKSQITHIYRSLKDVLSRDRNGTNRTNLNVRIVSESKDELGEVASILNETFMGISASIGLFKAKVGDLNAAGSNLSTNMIETAAAINEISANLRSIKAQTMNQSASVAETSATMEQMSKGIDKLSRLIEEQASNVTQSSSAIEEMMASIGSVTHTLVKNAATIKSLSSSSADGRVVLDKITAAIRDVSRESEGLMEISRIVQDIASQTNLLSMNAAIEAAHAGESGRGFAVVADEIRKLAESSSSQTKTISTVLRKIAGSMATMTAYADEVSANFATIETEVAMVSDQEDGIRRAMEEQSAGSKQILAAITALNEITQKVQSGSAEMLVGSDQVVKEARNMNAITQEITRGVNEVASGAEQITVAVNTVNKLSVDNKDSIDGLSDEVGKFSV